MHLIGPQTLLQSALNSLARMCLPTGLEGCDIVMMLRAQNERMEGALIPSVREYYRLYGLDREKLGYAKPDALGHPGPIIAVSRLTVLWQMTLSAALFATKWKWASPCAWRAGSASRQSAQWDGSAQ